MAESIERELPITGGCYCGAIRHRIDQVPIHSEICYCSNCRRAVGAHATSWVRVNSESFVLLQGELARYRTETSAWRTFCGTCGTSLTYQHHEQEREGYLYVTVGGVDRPDLFPPTHRYYEDERLPWDRTADR